MAEIVAEEKEAQRGLDGSVPVFLSSELYPMRRDLPRLNSTVIEAYAAEPSRATLKAVREVTKGDGAAFELRVMAAHGGTVSIEAQELARTLVSGPIGGVVGGQALARRMGIGNVLCTDIGGTSFDIALITDGRFEITQTPDVARFVLNMPLVRIDSIGAGTGSFVRVNPNSNRPELGPDSAGSRIGVSWPQGGLETISVTDLNLVLGRLNPDYFLGGEIQLDVERARDAVERQLARPLGLGVEAAAAGVIELFEQTLKNEAVGPDPRQGLLARRLHAALLRRRRPAARRRLHRGGRLRRGARAGVGRRLLGVRLRLRGLRLPLRPDDRPAADAGLRRGGTGGDRRDDHRAPGAACRSAPRRSSRSRGSSASASASRTRVRMQYYGQLNDIEFVSPASEPRVAPSRSTS